jgi:hypothetical protein
MCHLLLGMLCTVFFVISDRRAYILKSFNGRYGYRNLQVSVMCFININHPLQQTAVLFYWVRGRGYHCDNRGLIRRWS